MNIEQYQLAKSKPYQQVAAWSFAASIAVGMIGCRGTAPSFSQLFSGLNAPARVPPPAQGSFQVPGGSFQVPGTYSGGAGSSANPSGSGLGGSSFGDGTKTSQNTLPTNNVLNGISNAQSQLLTATNNARNSVNRAADGINSSVEQASARVDRFSQGVSQASAILSEAAVAPSVSPSNERSNVTYPTIEPPPISNSNSGHVGDSDSNDSANWRTPIRR